MTFENTAPSSSTTTTTMRSAARGVEARASANERAREIGHPSGNKLCHVAIFPIHRACAYRVWLNLTTKQLVIN